MAAMAVHEEWRRWRAKERDMRKGGDGERKREREI
jgi:hypothetical protein